MQKVEQLKQSLLDLWNHKASKLNIATWKVWTPGSPTSMFLWIPVSLFNRNGSFFLKTVIDHVWARTLKRGCWGWIEMVVSLNSSFFFSPKSLLNSHFRALLCSSCHKIGQKMEIQPLSTEDALKEHHQNRVSNQVPSSYGWWILAHMFAPSWWKDELRVYPHQFQ